MEIQNSKNYGLEERTFQFAKNCRLLVRQLPKTTGNFEDGKQLVRASGSVHANFIESIEALSPKDSVHRIRICRKEAKESRSWLRLVDIGNNSNLELNRQTLAQEALELTRIFGSILEKKK